MKDDGGPLDAVENFLRALRCRLIGHRWKRRNLDIYVEDRLWYSDAADQCERCWVCRTVNP